jgi:hypothetical protein
MTTVQQIQLIKQILDVLNEQYPITTDGIPVIKMEGGVQRNCKVVPHPHFCARQDLVKADTWWVRCTSWPIWQDQSFCDIVEQFEELAKQNGFTLSFSFMFIVGLIPDMEHAKTVKRICIGKFHSNTIY